MLPGDRGNKYMYSIDDFLFVLREGSWVPFQLDMVLQVD